MLFNLHDYTFKNKESFLHMSLHYMQMHEIYVYFHYFKDLIGSTTNAWHGNLHEDRDKTTELPIKDAIHDESLFKNENHSLKGKIRKLFVKQ